MREWEKYQCEYTFEGETWGVQIRATSHEDARRRLRAIGMTGQALGPIALEVHIPTGWIARAWGRCTWPLTTKQRDELEQ